MSSHPQTSLSDVLALPFQTKGIYNDNEVVKMRRLVLLIALVTLVMILVNLPASATPHSSTSLADNNISDDEIITNQTHASNSSANATITTTVTGILNE